MPLRGRRVWSRSVTPYSDIDLLILYQSPLTDAQQQAVRELIQLLWDLRLEVGHSVRNTAECLTQAEADVTVATSLLEQRLIAGDEPIAQQFNLLIQQQFPWTSRAFYQAKLTEQQSRHQHYHGTSYNLEPNVKSSPVGCVIFKPLVGSLNAIFKPNPMRA